MVKHKASAEKVLVALSGGKASAVAAALLKSQGFDLVGVHIHYQPALTATLQGLGLDFVRSDTQAAVKRVASRLDMPVHFVDASGLFESEVIDYVVHEILQQRVPSPRVAFGARVLMTTVLAEADRLKLGRVATGHFAQVYQDAIRGDSRVLRAVDAKMDQSSLLFEASQESLKRLFLPLGGIPGELTQKMARELGVVELADTLTSHGPHELRFHHEAWVPVVEERSCSSLRPRGVVRNSLGEVVGEHAGLYRHYFGQSRDLPIAGNNAEHYVVSGFEPYTQALILGLRPHLSAQVFIAEGVNWVSPRDGLREVACSASFGSREAAAPCYVALFENRTVRVEFEAPQGDWAPGQPIFFWNSSELLGGGWISKAEQ